MDSLNMNSQEELEKHFSKLDDAELCRVLPERLLGSTESEPLSDVANRFGVDLESL